MSVRTGVHSSLVHAGMSVRTGVHASLVHAGMSVLTDGTSFPCCIVSSSSFPMGEPFSTSLLSKSPVDKWVKLNSVTTRAQ